MIKTFCDVCGKEASTIKNILRIKDVSRGCDIDTVYMCEKCGNKYDAARKKLDVLFLERHGNITIT